MAYLIYLWGVIVISFHTPLIVGFFSLYIAFSGEEAKSTLMFTIGSTAIAAHRPALENMLNAVFSSP